MLVVAKFNEDVSWTQRQPYPVALMVKGQPEGTPFNTPHVTHGREGLSYLQFIIDNYDGLPEHIIFLHGHRTSWHATVSDALL